MLPVIGQTLDGITHWLLLKLLMGLEAVKQTQKLHSSILNSILRQGQVESGSNLELPEGIAFPLNSLEDVDKVEEQLMDAGVKKILVSSEWFIIYCNTQSMPNDYIRQILALIWRTDKSNIVHITYNIDINV